LKKWRRDWKVALIENLDLARFVLWNCQLTATMVSMDPGSRAPRSAGMTVYIIVMIRIKETPHEPADDRVSASEQRVAGAATPG
jgi:hypothetical protein